VSEKRLFAKWAQKKDRAALGSESKSDPKILCRALVCLFGPCPELGAKVKPESRLKAFCNRSENLDLAIVRQLVGQGFVRPMSKASGIESYSSQVYRITRKGWNEIINNSADLAADEIVGAAALKFA
jgi:isocitrate/isopropylmalate dehydrogenase